MNYIGSKLSLLPFLENSIKEAVGDISNKVFFDLFAGTGAVGNHFNGKTSYVIANDFEQYSYILNCNLLLNHLDHSDYIKSLNDLEPLEGFIWKHYSPAGGRMYFTENNAKKIDAIRNKIFTTKLSFLCKIQALSSLIQSADRVANTTSVYGAYLKKFKKTALKLFILEPAGNCLGNDINKVFNSKAEDIVTVNSDILYLDPPYNARQYGSNYHLLNTIISAEEFSPQGITGLPESYNKSVFCSKTTIEDSFYHLLKNAKAEHIFLSYNNEGLMSLPKIKEIMESFGSYNLFYIDYKRYKADNKRKYKASSTVEYLHYLKKK